MRYEKKPDEEWLVLMRQGGGQIEVAKKDTAIMDTDTGLIINHNDAKRTTTYIPVGGIAFVRTWDSFSGSKGPRSFREGIGRAEVGDRGLRGPYRELEAADETVVEGEVVDDPD